MIICIANTVEYNEWKTGRREEGIVFCLLYTSRECATCAAALASRKEKPARRRSSASAVYSTGNGGRP